MFEFPYIVELLSPKRSVDSQTEDLLERFAERYRRVMSAGCGVSIPDNPMGQPRMGALESILQMDLGVDPEKVFMNLNTFHSKRELDERLQSASDARLKYLLIVRGDGGPLLSKLDPVSIGGTKSVATSTDLIRYINSSHPGRFVTGAAFNPYKPMPFEVNRMKQKIDAGARFAVTQPIIGRDQNVDRLLELDIPVVVEAWMSQNVDLLYKSVGKEKDDNAEAYDPTQNLRILHESYPDCCVYLSMLSFKQEWGAILPKLSAD